MRKRHTLLLLFGAMALFGLTAKAQCPEVGYDKASTNPRYVNNGWDTAVTCDIPSIVLVPNYTVTAMTLNGNYQVDTIPYNPPDTTFHATTGGGGQLFANSDDIFASVMSLPFPFNFFGTNYRQAVVGANGVITFNTASSGQYCPYNFHTYCPIPSTTFPILNAIYGVYEDINPMGGTSGIANQGIYESIYDLYPCRKLCVSWNGIPVYGHSTQASTYYCTYQIVCYEGTNIIEVHVKRRRGGATANSGEGIIGVQNSAGTKAFWAVPRNNTQTGTTRGNPFYTDQIDRQGFRFTPLGDTVINFEWYRGEDTIAANKILPFSQDPNNDTLIMQRETLNQGGGRHGTLIYVDSKLLVQNITVSQAITVRLRFTSAGVNAAGQHILYDMKYTYHVGVDKDDNFTMTPTKRGVCRQQKDSVAITIPDTASSEIRKINWSFTDGSYNASSQQRIRNAVSPHGNTGVDSTSRLMILNDYNWSVSSSRMFDTIIVIANVTFDNGCQNYDTTWLTYVNNKNHTLDTFTCKGIPFVFHGNEYSQIGTYNVNLDTLGCSYKDILTLNLKDTNFVIWPYKDCHPYTWGDSTYSASTNTPTYTYKNVYGCDSTVNLNFTFDNSLKAIIEATPQHATLDDLNIQFKDVSLASSNRKWIMPDGSIRSDVTVYYNFPTDQDSIKTTLIAISNFGCQDTTSVTIPLLKQSIWFPNAFTPGRNENPIFNIKGIGIVSLHVEIYNRAGALVARWDGMDGYWDGNDLAGEPCPPGAYVYLAKYTDIINPMNPNTKKGTVLLIR